MGVNLPVSMAETFQQVTIHQVRNTQATSHLATSHDVISHLVISICLSVKYYPSQSFAKVLVTRCSIFRPKAALVLGWHFRFTQK